jgi:hypothetical protein
MRGLRLASILAAALVLAPAAQAAGPRFIMISGLELKRPVVLADWNENMRIMSEAATARVIPAAQLKLRPRYQVGEFWGPMWLDYLSNGGTPDELKPSQANQFGEFYPARAGKPAAIRITVSGRYTARRAGPVLLATLKAHGVRTRL